MSLTNDWYGMTDDKKKNPKKLEPPASKLAAVFDNANHSEKSEYYSCFTELTTNNK